MGTQSYILTTVVTPPTTTALVVLDDLKEELQIDAADTKNDSWLTKAINQASAQVSSFCNRQFAQATYQDVVRLERAYRYWNVVHGPDNPISTRRWPLVSVTSITETFGSTVTTLTEGTDFEVNYDTAEIYRLNSDGDPRKWPAVKLTIIYKAGYVLPVAGGSPASTLPADITDATMRLLSARWSNRGRDPYLKSFSQPGLGDKTWWVGGPPMSGSLPEEVAAMLQNYRVPVVA